ncbi:MAG: HEAT repeat domain-containing protein [Deltaproteobacteria bacterium]|nr:MAG: HEAT repeat domain-containing protein [Deltaproteobacteria bacterium]
MVFRVWRNTFGVVGILGWFLCAGDLFAAPPKKPPQHRKSCNCKPSAMQQKYRKLSTEKLIRKAQSNNIKTQIAALQALLLQGAKAKKAMPLLWKLSRSQPVQLRVQAILTIAHVDKENPRVFKLLRSLLSDQTEAIRMMAAHAISVLGSSRMHQIFPLFLRQLRQERKEQVRYTLLLSLQIMDLTTLKPRELQQLDSLLKTALRSPNKLVKKAATQLRERLQEHLRNRTTTRPSSQKVTNHQPTSAPTLKEPPHEFPVPKGASRPYTRIVVKTYKPMWMALLREVVPKGQAFDWRKAWKHAKQNKLLKRTPVTLYVRKHGMYTIVVYDPTAKKEKGKTSSDGLVMHKLDISPKGCCGEVVFPLQKKEFQRWLNL